MNCQVIILSRRTKMTRQTWEITKEQKQEAMALLEEFNQRLSRGELETDPWEPCEEELDPSLLTDLSHPLEV
jgi:hypothetical protein